jgi:RTX calcium-binding nonapeptide repeat (4 copies)
MKGVGAVRLSQVGLRRGLATTLIVAGGSLLALPAAASAASTITYPGGVLTFSADPGGSDTILSLHNPGQPNWNGDYPAFNASESVTYPTANCIEDFGYVVCRWGANGTRLVGGSGADDFSVWDDIPANRPVEVFGGGGDDILKDWSQGSRLLDGGGGNDTLEGGAGDDRLFGGDGNDKLEGETGSDELRAGEGDDELEGDGFESPSADVIDGGGGFDLVDEWTDPGSNNNPQVSVTIDGNANDGRPGEGDNVIAVEHIVGHASGTYIGTDAAEKFVIWSNIAPGTSNIQGLGGADELTGLDEVENIDGGAGDDRLTGGFNNDTITGGPGLDQIFADDTSSFCGIYSCQIPFGNDTVHAQDGEVDNIDCGVGTDTANVDAIDVVANCETVNRVGGGGGGGGGTGGGGGGSPAEQLGLQVAGAIKARRLRARGLAVAVTCPAACTVSAKLRLKRKALGSAKKTALAGGTVKLRVKLSRKGKRALRGVKRAKLTLAISVASSSGTQKLSKKVTLRR